MRPSTRVDGYLAVVSQYYSNKDFASIIKTTPGGKKYVETGMFAPDEISDETLDRILDYFSKLL